MSIESAREYLDRLRKEPELFKEAAAQHIAGNFKKFEELTDQVARLESEADAIKRNIRNHLPRGILMPVDKFQLFDYLREQDKVLDDVEEALFWLSFRPRAIPDDVKEDFQHLVDSVIPAIEKMPALVSIATVFFRNRSEEERKKMKSLIYDIRQHEKEADLFERELKRKIFKSISDTDSVYV